MIVDTLRNSHLYYDMAPGLDKAFEWIKNTNFDEVEAGAYEIDGKKVVGLVQEYDTQENPPWETHDFHIDVQFLHKGEELIGYYPRIEEMVKSGEYNQENDYDLYEDIEGDYVTLKDDVIMILFPQDGHVPRKAVNEPMAVKKVIVKIML